MSTFGGVAHNGEELVIYFDDGAMAKVVGKDDFVTRVGKGEKDLMTRDALLKKLGGFGKTT